jgi:hypothetical protein
VGGAWGGVVAGAPQATSTTVKSRANALKNLNLTSIVIFPPSYLKCLSSKGPARWITWAMTLPPQR